MATLARGPVPAGIYHAWRRTTGPIAMFRDDFDRTDFCNRLQRTIKQFGWTLHAFCLMKTHYHFVVEVDDDKLQPGMKALNGPYAQEFNRRWKRSGHLRAGRYKLRRLENELEFLRCIRYVERNPVEAGECAHPADWLWSSYRGAAGYDAGFPFVTSEVVLATFHENRAEAERLLRLFVEA